MIILIQSNTRSIYLSIYKMLVLRPSCLFNETKTMIKFSLIKLKLHDFVSVKMEIGLKICVRRVDYCGARERRI